MAETQVEQQQPAIPAHQIVEVLQDSSNAPAQPADEQNGAPATEQADDQNGSDAAQGESSTESKETEEEKQAKESRRNSRRQRAREAEVARLAAAETEARLLRERLARQEAQTQSASNASPEPKREDFDSLEDYHRALARHEAQQVARQAVEDDRKARQERETQARTAESEKRIADQWEKGQEAFRKEAKDYDEVVNTLVENELKELDLGARRAILESEVGQRVLYHLAKNPEEAERIAKLSPTRQVIEIGKLEDKVVPQKKQTSAPAPVSTVKGNGAAQGFSENMSQADYEAWRKKQGAKWAR